MAGDRDRRELVEVQVHALVAQPGRVYDLIHALIEECYRRSAAIEKDHLWRRMGYALTVAEGIARRIDRC